MIIRNAFLKSCINAGWLQKKPATPLIDSAY